MNKLNEIEVYIRFCETDASGHVSNTSYFSYFEEARIKFLTELGFIKRDRNERINFILGRTDCDFLAQAFALQTLTVTTEVLKIGKKSFTVRHEIKDTENNVLIAKGTAVMVCFDYEAQQTIPVSEDLKRVLEDYLIVELRDSPSV
ncbi:acyl-CoA thioesterase [Sporosarcina sp. CAU 1771]